MTTKAKIHSRPSSGKANFHQRRSGIPATVSTVMVVPLAGVTMLVKASPIWKASTAACRVIPHQVGQRRHDGHGDGRLTGTGGNHQVEHILYDEHAKAQQRLGKHAQAASQEVDDGIQDLAVAHEQG